MAQVYRIYRRKGVYYSFHGPTGKRESLHTSDKQEARAMIAAKSESVRQPQLNLKLAKVYLSGSDPKSITRTWGEVIQALIETKRGDNQRRWKVFAQHKPCAQLWKRVVIETHPEDFWQALNLGKVSTNKFLRVLHNFAHDMGWLQTPVIPKRQWPKVEYRDKRAITADEHARIIARENNPERKAFYQLAWHTGAAQSDLAHLQAEDVNWNERTISFFRGKTGESVMQSFGEAAAKVLFELPHEGALFPYLATVRAGDRATEFGQRCKGLGIKGISLHCYRYAWAQRARRCGYPERFAMNALGHSSKAVHQAYGKHANVVVPPLEIYEEEFKKKNIVPFVAASVRMSSENATNDLPLQGLG